MFVPFTRKIALFEGVTICNLWLSPQYSVFFIVFLAFAVTTYVLTRQKWYDKLILVLSCSFVYTCIYIYVLRPYYVALIIFTAFFLLFLYALLYSLSNYGWSLSSFRTMWKDVLSDYNSYTDKPKEGGLTSVLLSRITFFSIFTDNKLNFFEKLKNAWLLFYYSTVLGFIVSLNAYFNKSRLLKFALFIIVVSKSFILYLYDLSVITPVSMFDRIIFKAVGYFSLCSLFMAMIIFCLLVVLALSFDKEGWVKQFEVFYGKGVLSKVGYNSPYKSLASKLIKLGLLFFISESQLNLLMASCIPMEEGIPDAADTSSKAVPSETRGRVVISGSRDGSGISGTVVLEGSKSTINPVDPTGTVNIVTSQFNISPELAITQAYIKCTEKVLVARDNAEGFDAKEMIFNQGQDACVRAFLNVKKGK